MLESICNALSQVSTKLTEFDERLNRLETSQALMIEQRIPAEIGQLGGKTLSTSVTGAVQRRISLSFCDSCGKRTEEANLILCYTCSHKVCKSCLVKLDVDFLCVQCLNNRVPLSKEEFKVLAVVTNEIEKVSEIGKITKMGKDDVRATISDLQQRNLVKKKGILLTSRLEVTHDGLEAYGAYRSVYDANEDLKQFYNELAILLGERKEN
jgi:DNA-binding MarR family transcriptional regulator